MARRHSFVPQSPSENALEGRVVLSSFFGSVGDWFNSEYNNVKEDLGITHRPSTTRSSTADNNSLLRTTDSGDRPSTTRSSTADNNSLLRIAGSGKTTAVLPFHGTQFARVK
jgi:hypothetical protein